MDPAKLHARLFGRPPTRAQRSLYEHQHARGWLNSEPNPEYLLGTFVLALGMALPLDGVTFQRTFFLMPQVQEAWVTERIRVLTKHVLTHNAENRVVYNVTCKSVGALWFAPRVLQMEEPARWVAFGFGEDCPIPAWLQARLLTTGWVDSSSRKW